MLQTRCTYYSNFDYDYKKFIKIGDINHSQPDGYVVRMILYLMGERDAHVLLTMNDHPDFERELVYEFGKVPSSLDYRNARTKF